MTANTETVLHVRAYYLGGTSGSLADCHATTEQADAIKAHFVSVHP